MSRFLLMFILPAALFALSGCETRAPAPDGQKASSRAQRAQDELSSEVDRMRR